MSVRNCSEESEHPSVRTHVESLISKSLEEALKLQRLSRGERFWSRSGDPKRPGACVPILARLIQGGTSNFELVAEFEGRDPASGIDFHFVAREATERGYSYPLWFCLALVLLNPFSALFLLAMLPNARRQRLREEFAAELRAKLAARSPTPTTQPTPAAHSTFTGRATVNNAETRP